MTTTTSFDYTITDGITTAIGTVVVNIEETTPNANAQDDINISLIVGGSVLINVLSNDTPSGVIINSIVTPPVKGSAVIENGQIRYTANTGQTGTDSFTYEILYPVNNSTDTANVSIMINSAGGRTPLNIANGANIEKLINEDLAPGNYILPAGTFYGKQLKPKSGVNLAGRGKGVTIIKMKDNSYSSTAGTSQRFIRVFAIDSKNNIALSDMTIDGNRAGQTIINDQEFDKPPGSLSGGENGGYHCINISGNSSNITLTNLELRNGGTDGLRVEAQGIVKLRVTDCEMINNRRQGCSIIKGEDMYFLRCTFRDTNGCNPEAGCDIEPNVASNFVKFVTFDDCDFINNNKSAMMTDSKQDNYTYFEGIKYINCRSPSAGRGFEFKGREGESKAILFRGCNIKGKAIFGGSGSGGKRYCTDFIIEDCIFGADIEIRKALTGSTFTFRDCKTPSGNASIKEGTGANANGDITIIKNNVTAL